MSAEFFFLLTRKVERGSPHCSRRKPTARIAPGLGLPPRPASRAPGPACCRTRRSPRPAAALPQTKFRLTVRRNKISSTYSPRTCRFRPPARRKFVSSAAQTKYSGPTSNRPIGRRKQYFVEPADEISIFHLLDRRNFDFVHSSDDHDLVLKFLESKILICNFSKKSY